MSCFTRSEPEGRQACSSRRRCSRWAVVCCCPGAAWTWTAPGTVYSSDFPSNGRPYGTITLGTGWSTSPLDTIEHLITHELGHTLGLRHTDYYSRTISCGTGGSEGTAGVGAILIPGTPSTASVNGSIFNACLPENPTGESTRSDITAPRALFSRCG
jgi:hypothetical protein